jgi:hypothetical protein
MTVKLPPFLDLHRHSLSRGNVLVLVSLAVAVKLSDFPHNRATLFILLPALFALAGMFETVRCMTRRRWNLYQAGVMFCLYMDLMSLAVILFLLVYPFGHFLSAAS